MGINPTQPNHKAFTFDGTSSRNYGVYITGEAVFNAPQRDVQMVDIPGRNGAYALDKGNFNNITVKYPASIVADNETDFAEAVSDLRNFLCSKTGYCRLEDEYNPNEYRMAIYKSGLEVSHDMLTAGEFDITFECKPQRWLKSGESVVTLTSGNDITNPTLFDARPMLEVKGYGSITIGNDATISIDNGGVIGNINLYPYSTYTDWECTSVFSAVLLNTADSIKCNTVHCVVKYTASTGYSFKSLTLNSQSGDGVAYTGTREVHVQFSNLEFVKGTAKAYSETVSYTAVVRKSGGTDSSSTRTPTVSINYDGNETITITCSSSLGVAHTHSDRSMTVSTIVGNSTKSALGNPMYIDLDIGECWNEDSGVPVSVNSAVSLPAELPMLPRGNTTITFDNTFTQVDIVPRWWIV